MLASTSACLHQAEKPAGLPVQSPTKYEQVLSEGQGDTIATLTAKTVPIAIQADWDAEHSHW
jgi:hypothetical protein